MRRAGVVLATAGLLLLTACGGGDEPTTAPTSATPAPTETTPGAVQLAGTPVPEALSGFRCEELSKGWAAAGFLKNSGKQGATFQVTVYLGPADGAVRPAVTREVPDVAPGGSVDFLIEEIPIDGDGPCHVQVLRSDP